MKQQTKKAKQNPAVLWITALTVLFLIGGCAAEKTDTAAIPEKEKETVSPSSNTAETTQTSESEKPAASANKPQQTSLDPYKLSFTSSSLLFDSDLRNILSSSPLEYCSYVTEKEGSSDLTLTWNLKSTGKEVYRCEYSFNKKRNYSEWSKTSCRVSEAYEDYRDGDKALIRDYVMPEKDDDIDMFVHEKSSSYYESYFILGKYSDMYCYIKGDDIYFEYYWYQNTEDGPAMVYKSTARNMTTTSGQRYRSDLWELFEESCTNIDIIPYSEYPRTKDYYEVYHEWKDKDRKKKDEKNQQEMIETYCSCTDEDDLYSEYRDDFDSWEDAEDFWDSYCDR